MYFDSHAHYDDAAYNTDREAVLQKVRNAGVEGIVDCASDLKSLDRVNELAERHKFIYAAFGFHPGDIGGLDEEAVSLLYDYAESCARTVAVGEIGLDYHYPDNPSKEMQQDWFIEQIEMAKDLELPIIVHSRDAAKDTYDILKEYDGARNGGVIHSYSGAPELAKEYVRLGFHLGIGGMVTFQNAKKVVATVAEIPLEHLLLETDCPYLAPAPYRGKRNDSSNLQYIAARIAEIKGVSAEEVARITTENARRLFRLEDAE
ncbi:MAG: TatD family hydrolase [Firmicutes bacterium]|nr:TatD family hydrolase [Bacillota bacterium]